MKCSGEFCIVINNERFEDMFAAGLFTSACYDMEFLSWAPILMMSFSTVFYFLIISVLSHMLDYLEIFHTRFK